MSRNPETWVSIGLAALLATSFALAQTAPDLRTGDADAPAPAAANTLTPSDLAPPANDETPPPKPKRRKKSTLRALAPYPGAARIGQKGGPTVIPGAVGPTVAAAPVEAQRRPARDDRPFDPVGVYVGNLKLTPYVEEDVGYSSNPLGTVSAPRGSLLTSTEVGVGLQSNWSRNELTGSLRLGYAGYPQVSAASAPFGAGLVDYRFDASRDLAFDVEGRYNLATETYSQLGLGGAASQKLALVSTYGATLGANQKFGDLTLGLHGTLDRQQYDGGVLSSDDYTDYGLKLRAAYRLSEAVSPYLEGDVDTRNYDQSLDASGYDRASQGYGGKAGVKLSFSQMLTGDVSLGYGVRDYRDSRLPNASAPLIDGSLVWSATPLTTLTLKTSTLLQDAVVAGASADINRAYTVALDHEFTQRIKLGLTAGLTTDRFVGTNEVEHTYNVGLAGEYHLSREVVLKANYLHQQFVANVPGSNYNSDTVTVGVRLQR